MRKFLAGAALTLASALVLAGCSTAPAADDGRVHVVATTNVYGSLVAQIGGDRVSVTSLIDSNAQDPHSFEATARDRLEVQRAALVVENGGGYDSYMAQLTEQTDARIITAFDLADGTDDNEHVWFDVHTMTRVVERIAADLGELDPAGASDYAAGAEQVTDELASLQADVQSLRVEHEGQRVFITEPLPGLLAEAVGLDDVAPEGFAAAVEEGDDVPPAILLEAVKVIDRGGLRAVLTTAQTGGSETTRVTDAAKQAGIPVVTFSELLGPEQTYAQWMRAAVDELAKALTR